MGKKNFEAKPNPYYSSEFASGQGCVRTQGGQSLKARAAKAACSPFQGCCGQGWDAAEGTKGEHCPAEVGSTGCFGIAPFPIREQSVPACSCSAPGAAQSSLACTDQDLPAGSAWGLLVNSGKTANHRKSDTEIAHTQRHK